MARLQMQARGTRRQCERGGIAGQRFGAALLLSQQAAQRFVTLRVGGGQLHGFPQLLLGPLVIARVGEQHSEVPA